MANNTHNNPVIYFGQDEYSQPDNFKITQIRDEIISLGYSCTVSECDMIISFRCRKMINGKHSMSFTAAKSWNRIVFTRSQPTRKLS